MPSIVLDNVVQEGIKRWAIANLNEAKNMAVGGKLEKISEILSKKHNKT